MQFLDMMSRYDMQATQCIPLGLWLPRLTRAAEQVHYHSTQIWIDVRSRWDAIQEHSAQVNPFSSSGLGVKHPNTATSPAQTHNDYNCGVGKTWNEFL